MDTVTVVLILVVGLQLAVLVWLFVSSRRLRPDPSAGSVEATLQMLKAELLTRQTESLSTLRQSIDSANRLLNERLAEGTSALDRRLSIFGEIENKLGELSTQAQNIEAVGNNISSLSDLLRPPKLRGNLGEMLLENLLGEILPRALFETQYSFAQGRRVDAVVKLAGKLLPIDAKFPLEAFERLTATPEDKAARRGFFQALKKHVDDISSRYVRPDENTTDFAVMYIPAEAVYYQLVSDGDRDGFEYALSKKVVPSSPGHLYSFLASIGSIYAGLNLELAGMTDGSRKLTDSLNELAEAVSRLERFHERMNGSMRSLTISFEKAREETSGLSLGLEKLRQPFSEDEPAVD